MAAIFHVANKLKMFAWDNEDVYPLSLVQRSYCVVPCLAMPCQIDNQ